MVHGTTVKDIRETDNFRKKDFAIDNNPVIILMYKKPSEVNETDTLGK